MLTRRPAHELPSPIVASHSSALPGPASPLERNPLSPKGWKKRDSEGVGLSMVAKLECGGGERRRMLLVGAATAPITIRSARAAETGCRGKLSAADSGKFPVADFLSCCYLCRKTLQGKDIYMYRGEKAFCSMECRYQQIVSDELLEKWGSEVLRRADVSSSPCSGDGGGDRSGRLFFTGITAA